MQLILRKMLARSHWMGLPVQENCIRVIIGGQRPASRQRRAQDTYLGTSELRRWKRSTTSQTSLNLLESTDTDC